MCIEEKYENSSQRRTQSAEVQHNGTRTEIRATAGCPHFGWNMGVECVLTEGPLHASRMLAHIMSACVSFFFHATPLFN